MSCSMANWSATAAGEPRVLRVRGEGECTQGGHTLRLIPDNEGVVNDPALVVLRLEIDEPQIGTDVMTPTEVKFETEVDRDVVAVEVRLPDGPPISIDVKENGY
jgi:hypothetical protein